MLHPLSQDNPVDRLGRGVKIGDGQRAYVNSKVNKTIPYLFFCFSMRTIQSRCAFINRRRQPGFIRYVTQLQQHISSSFRDTLVPRKGKQRSNEVYNSPRQSITEKNSASKGATGERISEWLIRIRPSLRLNIETKLVLSRLS